MLVPCPAAHNTLWAVQWRSFPVSAGDGKPVWTCLPVHALCRPALQLYDRVPVVHTEGRVLLLDA